ncbi:MAG TPA: autotransporter domain-containing protein, partial [Variovorax sp.]|nr:autotransporter domain-containing protein [Variovorax sp.]
SVFAGTISGSGALRQAGSGTTVLTADNTYGGGTTITVGTLQLGNGGTSGSITGDVTNNGRLAFNRSDAVDFAGAISGSGGVSQLGGGTTTLSGANSYTGGTLISAGKLIGSAGSFGAGAIVDNAALEIRQATDATFANAISGNGSFTKSGAGALNLTGDSSAFTGSTLVKSGTLAVNGSLGGALTMASGTTLKGNGTVGTTVVQSGATVAPGNSIGTLHVAGDLTLAAGSTYQVEAAVDGRSDLIRATGAIHLQGGSLAVLADGNWNPTTTYTILNAGAGVNGSFGGITTNFAFLDPTLTYSAQDVVLSLKRNDTTFESVGNTPNESQAGGAVDASGSGALYNAVVKLDAVTARSAFAQLGGELHASLKSMAIEDSRYVRDAGLDHARRSLGGVATGTDTASKDGVWAYAFGARGDIRGDGNASKIDGSTSGLLIGGDTKVGDDWRVGLMAGYSSGSADLDARASSASSDSWHLGVYGGRQWGALGLRLGASYSDSSIDTRRAVVFGNFADLPTASYKAQTAQLFGELGWRIDAGAVAVEPFAGLAYVNLHTDDFSERGGFAALHGAGDSTDIGYSTLGVRATTDVELGGAKMTLRGMLGWRHAIGSTSQYASMALASQSAFVVAGVPIAKDAAVVEAGLDFSLRKDLTLGVSYLGQAGSGVTDNGVKATLLWKF